MYAVGSPVELGAWDPAHAIALKPTAPQRWSGAVVWPTQQAIKWKCVIRSLSNVNQAYWQKDPDNSLTTGADTEAVGSF